MDEVAAVVDGEVVVVGEGEVEVVEVVGALALLKVTQTLRGSAAKYKYSWRDCQWGPRCRS